MPATEAELAAMIRECDARVALTGGATRHIPQTGPEAPPRLSTARLTGVTRYEPGALTLVARAGTPLAEIEALLASHNQRLPFEPMDHRVILHRTGTPTLGGMIALNHCGPRRVQAGAARDLLLGLRFVDGTGRIVKSGGRVMKNVTGYDLARLHCGARGTLGVISEVALKVLPAPEAVMTFTQPQSDPVAATHTMSRALGAPFEISGAAWDGAQVLLRIEGFAASVRYRGAQLQSLIPDLHPLPHGHDPWPDLRDVRALSPLGPDIWRICARASHGARAAGRLQAAGVQVMLDWGGALVWAAAPPGTDLRAHLHGLDGHATRLRGTAGDLPECAPQSAPVTALSARLRQNFDPKGLFQKGSL
ncbi:FAD-binding protein [Rhodobacteraceae bacterium]|nr:FAD-binding protein [Paracoccaceae bacterium]